MKKTIFFFLIVFLFSCQKQEDYCWECITEISISAIGLPPGYSITNPDPDILDTCNMTNKEMESFELANTKSWEQNNDTFTLLYSSTCNCRFQ
jgi:hypothetical protein